MSTILLTGANGFVGSHVLPALVVAGHAVVALVRSDAAADAVFAGLEPRDHPRVTARLGDVTQPDTLPAAVAGVDAIVHLVAIPRDFNGGRDLAQVNTDGTRNIVRAAETEGVRRFIHLGALGVADDPRLHYASSKARAEANVRASALDWTILKPSLLWGEGDGFFGLIAGLVRFSPGIVPVPGDGRSRFQPRTGPTARSRARCSARSASGAWCSRCRYRSSRLSRGPASWSICRSRWPQISSGS